MTRTVAIISPGTRTQFFYLSGRNVAEIRRKALNLASHQFQGAYEWRPARVRALQESQRELDSANI